MDTTRTSKTDAQIQRDVLEELKWDMRVIETDVGVEVHEGVVILTGAVQSWASRLAAQEAAHRVAGVLDVANEIKVRLPGSSERDDTDLAHAIRRALEWDVFVPDEKITTTVTNGDVTIEGSVDSWSDYEDAARCVGNLVGVREVKNLLKVEPKAARVAPEAVRAAIVRALERHADRASRHVQIAVTEGKVILSGVVRSRAERDAIQGAVRGTPGVRTIVNELKVHAV
jgi:osmotically-inducible protein OsmY